MDDNALMKAGYDLLCDHFGLVEAAHFISLVNANRFDYTEWRKDHLFQNMTLEEISDAAMAARRARRTQAQSERPGV
jgi:hypothetical protein